MTTARESTESTVRGEIVLAIQRIANIDLGFDEIAGNVKDYALEHAHPDQMAEYLRGMVGGSPAVRCWSVDVMSSESVHATNFIMRREYRVRVRAYYDRGVHGAGVKLMVDHARKVRGAINGLGSTLNGLVNTTDQIGELSIRTEADFLVGEMIYRYTKINPSY